MCLYNENCGFHILVKRLFFILGSFLGLVLGIGFLQKMQVSLNCWPVDGKCSYAKEFYFQSHGHFLLEAVHKIKYKTSRNPLFFSILLHTHFTRSSSCPISRSIGCLLVNSPNITTPKLQMSLFLVISQQKLRLLEILALGTFCVVLPSSSLKK